MPQTKYIGLLRFLHKPGNVAGAVLVVLGALVGITICILHRRRSRKRSEQHSSTVWGPTSDVSFLDLLEVSPMRAVSTDILRKPTVAGGSKPGTITDSPPWGPPLLTFTSNKPCPVISTGIGDSAILDDKDVVPFGDLQAVPERRVSAMGLAVTTDQEVVRMRTHSYTPSSPSQYSTKTADEDTDTLFHRS